MPRRAAGGPVHRFRGPTVPGRPRSEPRSFKLIDEGRGPPSVGRPGPSAGFDFPRRYRRRRAGPCRQTGMAFKSPSASARASAMLAAVASVSLSPAMVLENLLGGRDARTSRLSTPSRTRRHPSSASVFIPPGGVDFVGRPVPQRVSEPVVAVHPLKVARRPKNPVLRHCGSRPSGRTVSVGRQCPLSAAAVGESSTLCNARRHRTRRWASTASRKRRPGRAPPMSTRRLRRLEHRWCAASTAPGGR